MITYRPVAGLTDKALVRYMDAECFPNDTPFSWDNAHFIIGRHYESELACYCAWKDVAQSGFETMGYHYRVGVMHNFRGSGLQKEMLAIREKAMKYSKLRKAVTYTDADGAASMNSLIKAGYKTYIPKVDGPLLSGEGRMGRVGFVHWIKDL